MKVAIIVGVGSLIGGMFRHLLSTIIQNKTSSGLPVGTLVVNLTGCFLIGCLFGLAEKWQVSFEIRIFLVTGILGGFTTFSAFSIETMHLIKTNPTMAGVYVLTSVLAGVSLTFFGAWVANI